MEYFHPELALTAATVLCLLLGAFRPAGRDFALPSAALGLAAFMALSLISLPGESRSLGLVSADRFHGFFRIFFGVVSAFTLIMMARSCDISRKTLPEAVSLLLGATVGMSMMSAARDMLMIYVSMETVSVLSYVLVGMRAADRSSSEAGLKYVLYGAYASGVMIFGFSLLYGLAGSTDLSAAAAFFRDPPASSAALGLFALVCILAGFGFKMATFPTHMWCPDVYEGAPMPVTAFLSVGPKAAGFALLIRFLSEVFGISAGDVVGTFSFLRGDLLLAVIAAVTMTLGNLAAIPQRNVKRLLAYSSIAHAGYLMMAVAVLNRQAMEAVLFYLAVYLFMNLGAFAVAGIAADRFGAENVEEYRALGRRSPVLAALFAIFLFSLTGLPPFSGFVGKLLLFKAVIDGGLYVLAVLAAVNTVISLFYYARILRAMYLTDRGEGGAVEALPRLLLIPSALMAAATVVLGIFWQPLFDFVSRSASGLFD